MTNNKLEPLLTLTEGYLGTGLSASSHLILTNSLKRRALLLAPLYKGETEDRGG